MRMVKRISDGALFPFTAALEKKPGFAVVEVETGREAKPATPAAPVPALGVVAAESEQAVAAEAADASPLAGLRSVADLKAFAEGQALTGINYEAPFRTVRRAVADALKAKEART